MHCVGLLQEKGKKVEEGTHAELMQIDVVKGKAPKTEAAEAATADAAATAAATAAAKEDKTPAQAKEAAGPADAGKEGDEEKDDGEAAAAAGEGAGGGGGGGPQARGQAIDAPKDEEVTLSGFYHLMWDTQMVRLSLRCRLGLDPKVHLFIAWLARLSLRPSIRHSVQLDRSPVLALLTRVCGCVQGEETFADAKLMSDEQLTGKLSYHVNEVKRLEAEADERKRTPSKEQTD